MSVIAVSAQSLPTNWCAAGMQSGESRELWGILDALNRALWEFFIRNGWRIVWESRSPDRSSFVLADSRWRTGSWKELARIDWLRGTPSDDQANLWWAQLYDSVPVFRMFSEDVGSTNTKGNVVEACVGASFVATHELRQRTLHFRTEPPEALAHAAAMFPLFAACGVSTPALTPSWNFAGVPAPIQVAVSASAPKAVSASATRAASASAPIAVNVRQFVSPFDAEESTTVYLNRGNGRSYTNATQHIAGLGRRRDELLGRHSPRGRHSRDGGEGKGTPATPMPSRPLPKAEPPTEPPTAAASASAPQAVSASAPKAVSASAPDSPAEPSDDSDARMEAALVRMEAAASRMEAAVKMRRQR